jgi:hypothetical protein
MTGGERAFEAAAAACPFVNRDAVRRILAAAEQAWPHEAPEALSEPATGADEPCCGPGSAFGFGKDVTA